MNDYQWKRMKEKDIPRIETMLRDMEECYTGLCGRFLKMIPKNDSLWMLCNSNKREEFIAIVLNSGSTVMPIFCGLKQVVQMDFLSGFMRRKKIHSVQGLIDDVLIIENEINRLSTGFIGNRKYAKPVDIYDYDLMTLDCLPNNIVYKPQNLVLRKPTLEDIEALLPIRKGYEEEEVLPRNSVFHPNAGRVNLANFITGGKILVAEINGKIAGKILVNSISYSRYQIGGIFVLPEYRGRGIGKTMTHKFVTMLINENKGITLFVKKNNIPARKIYDALGFKKKIDYRITYY